MVAMDWISVRVDCPLKRSRLSPFLEAILIALTRSRFTLNTATCHNKEQTIYIEMRMYIGEEVHNHGKYSIRFYPVNHYLRLS